jgi:hypothetical protein
MERVIGFWGPQAAELMDRSESVELMRLGPEPGGDRAAGSMLAAGKARLAVLARRDMSRAAGLVHLRQALLEDRSYAWERPPPASLQWDTALVFGQGKQSVTALFSLDDGWVAHAGSPRAVSVAPIVEGLRKMFAEQHPHATGDGFSSGNESGVAAIIPRFTSP